MLIVPVTLTLLLVAALWPWTVLYDRRPTVRLLATLTLTSGLVVFVQVVLGTLRALTPGALRTSVVATGALLSLGWLIRRRLVGLPPREPAASGGLYARFGLARPTRLGVLLGALVVLVYLAALGIASLVPPYGWDTLVYHLTDVVQAAATRSLARFPYPLRPFFFPQVGEIHSLWVYLLSGAGPGAWRLTGVALLPLALTAGVAVRAAAEALGLRAALPFIVPAMMLTPVVVIQPLAGYVDVIFAAFVLASYAFAVLAALHGRLSDLAFCALAGGLALGVSASFLSISAPILLILAAATPWRGLRSTDLQGSFGRVALCAALLTLGPGYWLGRNVIHTGNPLYPFKVKLAGLTVLEGPEETDRSRAEARRFVPSPWAWWRYPFFETKGETPRYTLDNGFGPQFAAGFVANVMALVLAARRRQWTLFRALVALPATIMAWLLWAPSHEPRHIIAACGFALVSLAVVTEESARGEAGADALSLLHASLLVALLFSAAGCLGSAVPDLPGVLRKWGEGRWKPEEYYVLQYGAAGKAFNWISSDSRQGATVTFTNSTFIAPLFGWHGRNRVVYAPTKDDRRMGERTRLASYKAWRRWLFTAGAPWVVWWVPWWGEKGNPRLTETWVAEHPEGFRLEEEFGGRVRVYRPVFEEAERAEFARLGLRPDLTGLDSVAAWRVEYRGGANVQLSRDLQGGIRVDYGFTRNQNDYIDLRSDVEEGEWADGDALVFDVAAEGDPVHLSIYLKDENLRDSCRFPVNFTAPAGGSTSAPPGRRRISLDLSLPEWCTDAFRLGRTAQLHVVIANAEERPLSKGALSIGGIRLEGQAR